MDIDIPDNAFSTGSNSAEPMFTPGGKRKRCFDQDQVQAQLTGQTLDEGSAAKQLRTLPPSAFNQNPISPFPISRMPSSSQLRSQNGSQPQTPLTAGPQDVFGSNPIFPSNLASASSSAHNTNQNATTSSADYFSRPLPALHDQSAPRLTNLTPDPTLNNDNNSTSGSVLGINSLAVQSFSQDLCPPRVGLMQPRTSYSNGTGMGMQQDGMNGTGAGSGMQMDGMMDLNGMPGTTGTTTSTPGLIEEVEKARNVHGPQCSQIPRLFLSDHPDPITGKRSMWAQCNSCGSIEMQTPADA